MGLTIDERITRAHEMVSALCRPRGAVGAREWMMSIPARRDHDPDLVIGDGLGAGREAVAALAACERERDEARKANATMQRRAQAAESAALRAARIEQRIAAQPQGKPLGRIEAGFALAAAETDAAALRTRLARAEAALEKAVELAATIRVAMNGEQVQERRGLVAAIKALAASPAAPSGGDEREGEVPDA